jgi:hypothetical protein
VVKRSAAFAISGIWVGALQTSLFNFEKVRKDIEAIEVIYT